MHHTLHQTLFSMPWHSILLPEPSWAEKIVRPILIYAGLLFAFRFLSKRDLTQNTTFDLLIVLLLSNIVQNAMIGQDNSVLGALAGALTLLLLSAGLNRYTSKNIKARRLLEGQPILLVHDGKALKDTMKKYAISTADLHAGLRGQNMITIEDVRYAFLELDGTISVIRKSEQSGTPNCMPPEVAAQYAD